MGFKCRRHWHKNRVLPGLIAVVQYVNKMKGQKSYILVIIREKGPVELSREGIEFIKYEEGERLTGYLDSRGVATIGVGHTGKVDNKPVTTEMIISSERSTRLLLADTCEVEKAINRLVRVSLNQNEYDALCSLVFNIGVQAFLTSTVLRKLNENDRGGAAEAILMWKRAGGDADILLPRRQREYKLFTAK